MSNKTRDIETSNGRAIVTAPVVTKPFIKKNGKSSRRVDFFLQRSVKDYFIKFGESSVGRSDLKDHLNGIEGTVKTVTLEVEFHHGLWDDSKKQNEFRSRAGDYVIIHRIVK